MVIGGSVGALSPPNPGSKKVISEGFGLLLVYIPWCIFPPPNTCFARCLLVQIIFFSILTPVSVTKNKENYT